MADEFLLEIGYAITVRGASKESAEGGIAISRFAFKGLH
jgi:hypothetical protein